MFHNFKKETSLFLPSPCGTLALEFVRMVGRSGFACSVVHPYAGSSIYICKIVCHVAGLWVGGGKERSVVNGNVITAYGTVRNEQIR